MVQDEPVDSQTSGKVAVLMGGPSSERSISLLSGNAVLKALLDKGVDAVGIDLDNRLFSELANQNIERVVIMLHGRMGEDGTVQAAMQMINMPYTGSGVLACALAMDKIRCKRLWLADNLSTPQFEVLDENSDWEGVVETLGTVFVKPVREGSSIGIMKATSGQELKLAFENARQFDREVLAEKWIEGPEFTVSILGDRILPVIELRTGSEFYDFHAKYESQETRYICPCELSPEKYEELETLALKAYEAVGCQGWGRVDVMQDTDGRFWLLEVNTVPGMTEHSLVPMAAREAGIGFEELAMEILNSSHIDRTNG